LVYLDANFMGFGWSYLHLLNGKRLPSLPGNSCLALNDLNAKKQYVVSK